MNPARVILLAAALAITVIVARPAALTPTARADWCVPVIFSSVADATSASASVFCKAKAKKPDKKRRTRCTDRWAQFRTLNARNFRWNLCVRTNRNPPTDDAHHVFPKSLEPEFARLDIPVHNPAMGAWWERYAHRGAAHKYNVAWRKFLKDPRGVTRDQAFQFACGLSGRYGFMVLFSCYNGPH